MMQKTERQFLELLKAGIWNYSVDSDQVQDLVDWKGILEIAEKQSVMGVVFDGIEKLPKNCLPDMVLLMD